MNLMKHAAAMPGGRELILLRAFAAGAHDAMS
jgi:hypothetical protein